jgi:hypothetical protein
MPKASDRNSTALAGAEGRTDVEKRKGLTLVIGRDGMGADATEDDFSAWVAFVCQRIDAVCPGFAIDIEVRHRSDVQSDAILGADDDDRQTIQEAKAELWNRWCAEGAP